MRQRAVALERRVKTSRSDVSNILAVYSVNSLYLNSRCFLHLAIYLNRPIFFSSHWSYNLNSNNNNNNNNNKQIKKPNPCITL